MRRAFPLLVLLVLLVSARGAVVNAQSAGSPAGRTVSASDLASDVQIVGLLGVPLGDLCSVRGRIVSSGSKETDRYLEITHVGDVSLPQPLELTFSVWQWGNLSGRTLPPDQVLSLRVYESGGMVGVPANAMKETTYVTSPAWAFKTWVVILYKE